MDTIPRFLLSLFLLAVTFMQGCVGGGVFFKERLVGRFAMWAVDGLSDNSLVEESEDGGSARVLIPPTVFAVGFNDQFIIAKRHPKSDDQIDRSTTEFYVVSVLGGQVHGPVDHEKFSALRARLGVPASLDFSRVIEQLAYQPSNRRVLKRTFGSAERLIPNSPSPRLRRSLVRTLRRADHYRDESDRLELRARESAGREQLSESYQQGLA